MEKKIRHLEMLQGVICRMAGNLFLLKGWSVTLVAALFALAAKDANAKYAVIALCPIAIFWLLDGFFLSQERMYRALYDEVRQKSENQIDFSMDVRKYRKGRNTWFRSFFSKTLFIFYGTLLVVMSTIILLTSPVLLLKIQELW